jgi:hypothetical protein
MVEKERVRSHFSLFAFIGSKLGLIEASVRGIDYDVENCRMLEGYAFLAAALSLWFERHECACHFCGNESHGMT